MTSSSDLKFTVNGDERRGPLDMTLATLLDDLGLSGRRVAIELNLDVVPKAAIDDTKISEGDRIEIVSFVGGG